MFSNGLLGTPIVTSLLMVEPGEAIEVDRTWQERLFTMPWRPFKKTKTVIPSVPKKVAIKLLNGTLVMHPEVASQLRKHIQ